jgi:L-asparagine transporter-like permease
MSKDEMVVSVWIGVLCRNICVSHQEHKEDTKTTIRFLVEPFAMVIVSITVVFVLISVVFVGNADVTTETVDRTYETNSYLLI